MTRDEILNLTPEQLRVEIARRKGWKFWRDPNYRDGECTVFPPELDYSDCSPYGYLVDPSKMDSIVFEINTQDWTTDIAAAWELVEEMIENGEAPGELIISWYEDKKWYCQSADRKVENYAYADTAPLAICRAWLMWRKGEDESI